MWPGKGQIRIKGNFLWSKLTLGVILREHEQLGWSLVSRQPQDKWALCCLIPDRQASCHHTRWVIAEEQPLMVTAR